MRWARCLAANSWVSNFHIFTPLYPCPLLYLQNTTYVTLELEKNHHPIGGRLICEWEYRWELSSHQVEDLRTGVSLCEYNCPSPSPDGRSYVHIEWPRQLLPSHCIANPTSSQYIVSWNVSRQYCISSSVSFWESRFCRSSNRSRSASASLPANGSKSHHNYVKLFSKC